MEGRRQPTRSAAERDLDNEKAAVACRKRVELAGERWPEGWVKGVGDAATIGRTAGAGHPLTEVGERYLNTLTNCQGDTLARYRRQLKVMEKSFPTIEDVTDDSIPTWIRAMQKAGKSAKTIANYHGLLFAVCAYAAHPKRGLLLTNPCADTKLPGRDADATEAMAWLTEQELGGSSTSSPTTRRTSSRSPRAPASGGVSCRRCRCATVSSTRRRSTPATSTSRSCGRGSATVTPATSGSPARAVRPRLPQDAAVAAHHLPRRRHRRHRATQHRRQVARGLRFHRAAGRAAVPAHLYADRWLPAVRAAQERHGLTKQPRFHDLRHTHAVWLITAGVPLPVIQDRLGHQSIQITVDVYGGFLTQAHDVVRRVLSAALRGEKVRHLRSA